MAEQNGGNNYLTFSAPSDTTVSGDELGDWHWMKELGSNLNSNVEKWKSDLSGILPLSESPKQQGDFAWGGQNFAWGEAQKKFRLE